MFGKLKDKLKSWTQKITKEKEEIEEPIKEEEQEEEIKEKTLIKKTKQKPEKKIPTSNPQSTKTKPPEKEVIIKPLEKEKQEISVAKPIEKTIEIKPKGFIGKLTSRISKVKITESDFEVYSEELEMLLLENNVAYVVTEKIITELKEKIVGVEILKKEVEDYIKDALKDIIEEILIEPFKIEDKIREKENKPYVILFCGINGTGKTTSIAKIADSLKKQNISSVIAAGDTFRAASIEQIKTHGEKIGIKVIAHDYGADPAAVAYDSIKYAEKNKIDCVLIDTAGRIHTNKNLLNEIEKISRVCKPDTTIYVGESTTGNDAVEQIKTFNFEIGIDGIILSKADIDEKGGTALSVGYVTKKPILYLGTGQEYEKIIPFNKNDFIEKLGL